MSNPDQIIQLEADRPFEVELVGPSEASQALVMVHGFGVKRDSRGLFLEIEEQFKGQYLCVRADFSEVHQDHCRAIPISTQAQRLAKIIEYLQGLSITEIAFIGHSQGSLVVAKAHPTQSKAVLLAPPIIDPAVRFSQTAGWRKPGSSLDMAGESQLVRSDGSITRVGANFWTDFLAIDAEGLYQALNADNKVTMLFAGSDSVLGDQAAPAGIASETIPDADHDFRGEVRQKLLQMLSQIL